MAFTKKMGSFDGYTYLAQEKRRYGYRRLHILLKREGIKVNHKRLFRIYKELDLKVRKRIGKKKVIGQRVVSMPLIQKNQEWSLDFVHDAITDGRRIRLLTIVDDFTRESLQIAVDTSFDLAPFFGPALTGSSG